MVEESPAIPFFGHSRLTTEHRSRLYEVVRDSLNASWMPSEGPWIADCEQALSNLITKSDVIGCSSGTAALQTALDVLAPIGASYEVVTTAFTFGATIMPAVNSEISVTVVDIDPETLLARDDLLEDAIRRTTNVPIFIPVHLNGLLASCPRARAATRDRGGIIIDDAAQHLADNLPSNSDAWCLSLGPTKNIMGIAEAGAVAFARPSDAKIAREIVRNGVSSGMVHERRGDNRKLDGVAAAVLTYHASMLREWDARRKELAQIYSDGLSSLKAAGFLSYVAHTEGSSVHKFPVLSPIRERLRERLELRRVEVGVHYPRALPDHPAFHTVSIHREGLESAKLAAQQVLTLPMHPWVTDAEAQSINTTIEESYE